MVMARIRIKDLPKGMKISTEELKRIRGGSGYIKLGGLEGESLLGTYSGDPLLTQHKISSGTQVFPKVETSVGWDPGDTIR